MRTKTLLTAIAALAAGITISNAQVYSKNVVGYANLATPGNGTINYSLAVPFSIGVSNGANEVFNPPLPDFSQLLIWDSGSSSYTIYQAASFSSTGWYDANFNEVPAPVLPVGQGFFLNPSSPITNTFSGAIAVDVGTSNKMVLTGNGTVNYLVGSVVPYTGSVTNGNDSGGGANLNGLPDFSQVLIWDPNTSSYTIYQAASFSSTGWYDANFNEVSPPTLGVGQSFFLNPAGDYTWTVGL